MPVTETRNEGGRASSFSLHPLMFEIFVCSMGMMAFMTLAGPIARIVHLQPWELGLVMTIAGVAWMLMAPVWGRLSDRHGRRFILLSGIAGFAASYLFLSVFVDMALKGTMAAATAFAGLVAGRATIGLFYAALPTATTALIADHVEPSGRTKAMAAIGSASAAGMVVGPGLAGFIARYDLSLPLYIFALLPSVAFLLLWKILPKGRPQEALPKRPMKLLDRRLWRPLTIGFTAMFCVAIAQITVGFYALDRLQLSPREAANTAGMALAVVGVSLIITQTILRRIDWPSTRLIMIGGTVGGLGFASAALATSPRMLLASYGVAALGMGWIYPSVTAMASNSVGSQEQGAAAGTMAAAQGFGSIVGPLAGTAIYGFNMGAPYILVGILLLTVALWPTPEQAKSS